MEFLIYGFIIIVIFFKQKKERKLLNVLVNLHDDMHSTFAKFELKSILTPIIQTMLSENSE